LDKKVLITGFGYVFSEPPSKNTLESFLMLHFCISVIHLKKFTKPQTYSIYENIETEIPVFWKWTFGPVRRIIEWVAYKKAVNTWLASNQNAYIWCVHLTALAAIDFKKAKKKEHKIICNVIDIPAKKYSGFFDRFLYEKAFRNSKLCYLKISSDQHKAALFQQFGKLTDLPIVLYNCSNLDYFEGYKRGACKQWLHNKLIPQKIFVNKDTIVLLRAGAIGNYGGIEETILAMKKLPKELIFILMGRPDNNYKNHLLSFVKHNKMTERVLLFDRPSDEEWKKILLACDLGHLIHVRPYDNPQIAALYDYNSSLSNNRLFQYMSVGVPILSYNDKRLNKIHNEINCFSVINLENLQESIFEHLRILSRDRNRCIVMGNNARQAFLNEYNWENQFHKVVKKIFYRNI
jgi:glycosyltransferase involved in cell wall biosynthesis